MTTDATRAHIDAETLAAWADRGLPADAAAAVELHLSNCDRCQEVLAAFVRSAPASGAVVIPFWARRPVQWSAAGLAAAAALVAMIWIGRPPSAHAPESTVALRDAVQSTPTAPVDQIAPPAEPRQEKSASAAQERSASAADLRRDRPSSPPSQSSRSLAKAAKKAEVGGAATAVTAPPPPPPAVTMPPTTVVAAAPPVPPPAAAAPVITPVITPLGATRSPATSENVALDAFSAVIPIIEIAAPDPSSSAMRSTAGGAGRGAVGARALTQSFIPTRWRIVAGARVERSLDNGATWNVLPIEPELKTPLLAGAATSQSNCWLVGRDGVVLVTHDGRTFRRVSVPEVVHLTGVTATDGMRATVTALDGRKFSTTDGGLTWK